MIQTLKKITALGDSIIKGVIAEKSDNNFKYKVADDNITNICSKELDIEICNLGKFGCTITAGEKIIEKNLEKISCSKYSLLEYGGNDSDHTWLEIAENPTASHLPKTPIEIFKSTYQRVINKMKEIGTTPIIINLPPIDSDKFFSFFTQNMNDLQKSNILKWLNGSTNIIGLWHEMYNHEIIKLAYSNNLKLIDVSQEFLKNRTYKSLLCLDGIHPNPEGQKLIAQTIIENMRDYK